MIRALRAAGIERVVLLTGDRADTAQTIGRIVGVDAVLSDCDPACPASGGRDSAKSQLCVGQTAVLVPRQRACGTDHRRHPDVAR